MKFSRGPAGVLTGVLPGSVPVPLLGQPVRPALAARPAHTISTSRRAAASGLSVRVCLYRKTLAQPPMAPET